MLAEKKLLLNLGWGNALQGPQASTPRALSRHLYPSHPHPMGNVALLVPERMTESFYTRLLNVATVYGKFHRV